MTIAVVTDAAADVPSPERTGLAWSVLPERWRTAGLELVDHGEHSRELTRLVLSSGRMSVQPPGVGQFTQAYAELHAHERVYSIHSAPSVSHAVESAREAAREHPNVRVVETSVAGIGVGLLAARVLQLAARERTVDEIDAWVDLHRAAVKFLIVPDRFDPVNRQRLSTAMLLAGKPIMSARGGEMTRSRRLRSRKATVAAIESYLTEHAPHGRDLHVAVGHGDAAGAVDPFLDIVERLRPEASFELVGRIGPRLVERLGSRCVGMAWLVG